MFLLWVKLPTSGLSCTSNCIGFEYPNGLAVQTSGDCVTCSLITSLFSNAFELNIVSVLPVNALSFLNHWKVGVKPKFKVSTIKNSNSSPSHWTLSITLIFIIGINNGSIWIWIESITGFIAQSESEDISTLITAPLVKVVSL